MSSPGLFHLPSLNSSLLALLFVSLSFFLSFQPHGLNVSLFPVSFHVLCHFQRLEAPNLHVHPQHGTLTWTPPRTRLVTWHRVAGSRSSCLFPHPMVSAARRYEHIRQRLCLGLQSPSAEKLKQPTGAAMIQALLRQTVFVVVIVIKGNNVF